MQPLRTIAAIAAWLTMLAGAASAYEFRLEPNQPGTAAPGQPLVFDVFLDTEGASNISSFSVSLRYDTSVLEYRPDLSSVEDYYPLYAPAQGGKTSLPQVWLVADFDPPRFSVSSIDPALDGQVNVEFTTNLGPTGATRATATNLWLATLAFDAGPYDSYTDLVWGLGGEGNVFRIGGEVAPTEPTFLIIGDGFVAIIPEPGTVLLVASGLACLGLARRRGRP